MQGPIELVMQRWTQWLIPPRELCSKGFAPSSRIALKLALRGGFLRVSRQHVHRGHVVASRDLKPDLAKSIERTGTDDPRPR
jgi:hypothetical protein